MPEHAVESGQNFHSSQVFTALPELAAQISRNANDMKPQELSNSLWAATRLKDDAPEVLQMVPALACNQADFSSQSICNCLEAVVLLQDLVPEVGNVLAALPNSKKDFVGFTASSFSTLLPTLKGKPLQFDIPAPEVVFVFVLCCLRGIVWFMLFWFLMFG